MSWISAYRATQAFLDVAIHPKTEITFLDGDDGLGSEVLVRLSLKEQTFVRTLRILNLASADAESKKQEGYSDHRHRSRNDDSCGHSPKM